MIAQALGLALVAATVMAGIQTVRLSALEALRADEQRTHALALANATDNALRWERTLNDRNREIADEQARTQADIARRIAARDRTISGLRAQLADASSRPRPADPAAARFFDEATGTAQLLGQCAERYSAVAGDAEELASQVIGLQRYAKEVCIAKKGSDG